MNEPYNYHFRAFSGPLEATCFSAGIFQEGFLPRNWWCSWMLEKKGKSEPVSMPITNSVSKMKQVDLHLDIPHVFLVVVDQYGELCFFVSCYGLFDSEDVRCAKIRQSCFFWRQNTWRWTSPKMQFPFDFGVIIWDSVPQWPRFECFFKASVDGLEGALSNLRQWCAKLFQ